MNVNYHGSLVDENSNYINYLVDHINLVKKSEIIPSPKIGGQF